MSGYDSGDQRISFVYSYLMFLGLTIRKKNLETMNLTWERREREREREKEREAFLKKHSLKVFPTLAGNFTGFKNNKFGWKQNKQKTTEPIVLIGTKQSEQEIQSHIFSTGFFFFFFLSPLFLQEREKGKRDKTRVWQQLRSWSSWDSKLEGLELKSLKLKRPTCTF